MPRLTRRQASHAPGVLPRAAFGALLVTLAFALSGCGGDEGGSRTAPDDDLTASALPTGIGGPSGSPTESPSGSPSPSAKTIVITIAGSKITPSGAGVEVEVGQPLLLEITSDRAGELHVHSTPEKQIEFPKGKSSIPLTIDQPGVVDVEEHASDKLIVQLEVS